MKVWETLISVPRRFAPMIFSVPHPIGNDDVMSYLFLSYPAIPLLQRTHFDLQTDSQQEEHSHEKANGMEMQGGFEWGSFSFNV